MPALTAQAGHFLKSSSSDGLFLLEVTTMKVHARRPGWLGAAVLGCAIALGAPASAHNVAEHSTSTSQKWPQASLNAEASASVLQDTVKVTLATELSAATQSAVARLARFLSGARASRQGKKTTARGMNDRFRSAMSIKNSRSSAAKIAAAGKITCRTDAARARKPRECGESAARPL